MERGNKTSGEGGVICKIVFVSPEEHRKRDKVPGRRERKKGRQVRGKGLSKHWGIMEGGGGREPGESLVWRQSLFRA